MLLKAWSAAHSKPGCRVTAGTRVERAWLGTNAQNRIDAANPGSATEDARLEVVGVEGAPRPWLELQAVVAGEPIPVPAKK